MKVAIVQEHVDVRRGGAETSTIEMARQLAALGLDVTVVCSSTGPAASRHAATEPRSRPETNEAWPTYRGWPTSLEVGDTNSKDANAADRDEAPNVKLRLVDVSGKSRMARTVRFVAQADRFCRDEGFDVVHAVTPCFSCNVYQPRGGTYVETVSRSVARAGGPLLGLIKRIGRRFNWRQRFLLLVEREILGARKPPLVAAVSEYVGQQVRRAFPGYPPDRLRVVFNGVDITPLPPAEAQSCRTALRRELGVEETTPLVLFVAHNFKLKGLRELINSMSLRTATSPSPTLESPEHPESEPAAQVTGHAPPEPAAQATGQKRDEATKRRSDEGMPGSGYVLAVVGRDNPAPYLRFARRRGVLDRVRFLGPRDDLPSLYAAADVLAHPTWYDPCSRVVLEALACGLPVVTTRFNGAAEIIEEGKHGVVIDSSGDRAALATAIATCLRPDIREACECEAAKMRGRVSMARHARELKALYEEIAPRKA